MVEAVVAELGIAQALRANALECTAFDQRSRDVQSA
jgi:hypothetical protein